MAKYQLLLPKMGESVAEATITKWLKNVGDTVEADDAVLEIATDKVDSEVPSPVKGKLIQQLYNEDDVVQVGSVIAVIETEEHAQQVPPAPVNAPAPAPTPAPVHAPAPVVSAVPPGYGDQPPVSLHSIPGISQLPTQSVPPVQAPPTPPPAQAAPPTSQYSTVYPDRFYSPLVKSIASQEGIKSAELERIPGTGAEGRLTKDDLLAYIAKRAANPYSAPVASAAPQPVAAPVQPPVSAPLTPPQPVAPPAPPVYQAPPAPVQPPVTPPAPPAFVPPAPVFTMPEPTPIPEPVPVHIPEPAPIHIPEPAPVHIPEPEPVHTPEPAPVPQPVAVEDDEPEQIPVTQQAAPVPVEEPAAQAPVPEPVAEAPVPEEPAQPAAEPTPAPAPEPGKEEEKAAPAPEKPTSDERPKTYTASGKDEIIEMDRMRRIISDHMVMSKHTSAHVTSFVEVDVTVLVQWREKIRKNFENRERERITFTPIFIEAVVRAIKDMPMINVSVNGKQIIKKKDINIGMATALPSGNLIVPVIHKADELSLTGLTKAVNDLAIRARTNKLIPDEVRNGTFTITNVGSFGNVMGTPIINQPQVAILAIGVIKKKPAVIETKEGDMIAIRHMMFLSLSYDHRVVDGALGGSFVRRVADYLENWDISREI